MSESMADVIEQAISHHCAHTGPVKPDLLSGCGDCAELALDASDALRAAGYKDPS